MIRFPGLFLVLGFVFCSFQGASQSIPFTTTWSTTDNEVTIPTFEGETYNYSVFWENLTNTGVNEGSANSQTGDYTISGMENGSTYQISIYGTFPRIYFNNEGDKDKILTIEQWGTGSNGMWTSMEDAFNGCSALTISTSNAPNLSSVTNMDRMFQEATSLNSDLSGWDVSNVESMERLFSGASSFNQSLGDWDIGNIVEMSNMLNESGLSEANYDATLIGWADDNSGSQTIPSNVTLGASGLTYSCDGLAARSSLEATYDWTISDGGGSSDAILVLDAGSLPDIERVCQVTLADLTYPTATDNCESETVTGTIDEGQFPLTTSTTLTWTFVGTLGNATTQDQNIVIVDNIAPAVDVASLSDLTDECSVSAPDSPTATDNCDGSITGVPDVTFPLTESTTITWTYTDDSGNTTTQDQSVVIEDNTAPVADAASLSDLTGECSVSAPDSPTATDNCDGSITGVPDVTFPLTESTTITWTYTDDAGNSTTQEQDVVVTCETPLAASEDTELRLFPNPANEVLEIRSLRNQPVQLLDLSGTVVMDAHTNVKLDISQLRSGVYLVSFKSGSYYRFVKQ